jgi:putative ABC transport system permease protein
MLTVVLADEDFDALLENGEIYTKVNSREYWPLTGINYTKALKSTEIAEELKQVLEGRVGGKRISYYTYNELLSIFGLICFIGFFMCAIFILMTASMLYFKQVTIATEEKSQYAMLKKIGLDSNMEGKIIRKRLLPIFFIPLIIGITHSIFAMKAADTLIFSNMIPVANSYLNVLATSGVMYLVYAIVYTVFYFITKGQYKRMLK